MHKQCWLSIGISVFLSFEAVGTHASGTMPASTIKTILKRGTGRTSRFLRHSLCVGNRSTTTLSMLIEFGHHLRTCCTPDRVEQAVEACNCPCLLNSGFSLCGNVPPTTYLSG